MFDLIGDIHGRADELEALLTKLGYRHVRGSYRHQGRKAIFLGDFVDRGQHQKRVIDLVRAMVAEGTALAVMGNHEFNAIAYHTPDGHGGFLRPRTEKNRHQHKAFLGEFEATPDLWLQAIAWFGTLPLWLDLPGLRVIHACWDQAQVSSIAKHYGDGAIVSGELLREASRRGTWQYQAVETLLKGKELPLPDGACFHDKDGHRRTEIRVRWWRDGATYRDVYMGPEDARAGIPDVPIEGGHAGMYGREEKPVFIGHYWLHGEPAPLASNIACLDYSVARPGGKLVAYRWDGESAIRADGYVWCDRHD